MPTLITTLNNVLLEEMIGSAKPYLFFSSLFSTVCELGPATAGGVDAEFDAEDDMIGVICFFV